MIFMTFLQTEVDATRAVCCSRHIKFILSYILATIACLFMVLPHLELCTSMLVYICTLQQEYIMNKSMNGPNLEYNCLLRDKPAYKPPCVMNMFYSGSVIANGCLQAALSASNQENTGAVCILAIICYACTLDSSNSACILQLSLLHIRHTQRWFWPLLHIVP